MDAAKLKWDVFTYNAVLNCQSKARLLPPHEPARLLAKMEKECVKPNVVTLNTALKFHARSMELELALELVRSFQAAGVAADAITYNTLLNICSKAGLMSRAESILEEMQNLGMQHTPSTVTTLITGYGRIGAVEEAERVAGLLPHAPAITRALAAVLVDADSPARALQLLQPHLDFPVDNAPRDARVRELLRERRSEVATLNTALMALRAHADNQAAAGLELVSRARDQRWAVDLVTLNTLMDMVCVAGGYPDLALPVLSRLAGRQTSIQRTAVRADAGADGEAKAGVEALAVALEMTDCILAGESAGGSKQGGDGRQGARRRQKDRQGSIRRIATSFIRGCARVQQQQQQQGNSTGGLGNANRTSCAHLCAALLADLCSWGYGIDTVLLTAAVDACALCGDVEGARDIMRRAKEQWQVCTSLARARTLSFRLPCVDVECHAAQGSREERVRALLRRCFESSLVKLSTPTQAPPQVATYNALLKALRNAGGEDVAQRCDDVLDDMAAAGVSPDIVSFNTMLRAGMSTDEGVCAERCCCAGALNKMQT